MNAAAPYCQPRHGVKRPVTLWWLDVASISDADWPALERLLQTEEIERARRFHFERDRQSYIAAHALNRALLSHWTGHEASSWRFTVGDHGKPEVVAPPEHPGLRVNLSHTRSLVAAALTLDHDIGVDVEWVRRSCDIDALSQRVFTPEERVMLDNTPEAQKRDVFFTLWTLKEAYIKATGKGLSQPLSSFYFELDPLTIGFKTPSAQNDPLGWQFHHMRLGEEHRLSLAVHHRSAPKLAIEAEAAPLEWMTRLR